MPKKNSKKNTRKMIAKKITYKEFIKDKLRSGEMSFEKVFELSCTKFNYCRTTFAKYWKQAQQEFEQEQQEMSARKKEKYISQTVQELEFMIGDKAAHAKELINSIQELEKEYKTLISIETEHIQEYIQAKRAATAIKAEVRQHRKLIADWYGFNAPEEKAIKVERIFFGGLDLDDNFN